MTSALWTKADLAFHLRVSLNHCDAMERQGRLPLSMKLGNSKRWKSAEILQWIDDGCPAIDSPTNGEGVPP